MAREYVNLYRYATAGAPAKQDELAHA